MTEVVLDASVVLQWFTAGAEGGAARIRDRFESGRVRVVVPRLLFLKIVNVTARRWGGAIGQCSTSPLVSSLTSDIFPRVIV